MTSTNLAPYYQWYQSVSDCCDNCERFRYVVGVWWTGCELPHSAQWWLPILKDWLYDKIIYPYVQPWLTILRVNVHEEKRTKAAAVKRAVLLPGCYCWCCGVEAACRISQVWWIESQALPTLLYNMITSAAHRNSNQPGTDARVESNPPRLMSLLMLPLWQFEERNWCLHRISRRTDVMQWWLMEEKWETLTSIPAEQLCLRVSLRLLSPSVFLWASLSWSNR